MMLMMVSYQKYNEVIGDVDDGQSDQKYFGVIDDVDDGQLSEIQ